MLRRIFLLLVIAAVAGLAVQAQSASAAEISFDGINGVQLHMSEATVRDELGRPSSSRPAADRSAVVLNYRRRKLEVTVQKGRDQVVVVRTTARSHKTRNGLRVGSSERAVRAKLREETCSSARGKRVCSVEGATLDWIDRPELPRDTMRELLVRTLGGALRAIEELDPSYPAPEPARRDV